MKDFKAIFKTYTGKVRNSFGFKTTYGKLFIEGKHRYKFSDFYERMFYCKPLVINDFIKFIKKYEIKNALEIGCGVGLSPRKIPEIFQNIEYTGIDISPKAIDIAKKLYPQGKFVCGDFIKYILNEKFDLVFSFDVVDHVYDVDSFLSKMIDVSKKMIYVNAYRGYFPELNQHKIDYRYDEGVYYNNLSIKQIKRLFAKKGLREDQFSINSQSVRDEILYDSDLGRAWNRGDEKQKDELMKLTNYDSEFLQNLPNNFETSTSALVNLKNKIKPEDLGLSVNYNDVSNMSTVIKINKI